MNYYERNRARLFDQLENGSIVFINSGEAPHKTTDQFYHFHVDKNFFYLTGIKESSCILMMIKSGDEEKSLLFIDETTEFMKQWLGAKISKEEASAVSGLAVETIMYKPTLPTFFRRIMSYNMSYPIATPSILYLDLLRPTNDSEPVGMKYFKQFTERYPELQLKNINKHLSYLRMFKNDYEIEDLKKAIHITNEGIKRMMKEVGHRYNESQLEADFMHEIRLNGAKNVGFDTILASGKNATILHYEDNNSRLHDGDLVLCDLGAEYDEYSADITRTFPINGVFSDRQKEIYRIVLKTNKEAIKFLKPGITWKELESFTRDILVKECQKIELIKEGKELNKYYYHTIGHHLGLDVHDVGDKYQLIQEGMVLTIEPGLYIKEEGIGVRIEDDILITKDGCINLSKDIMKEIDDIERFMR